MHLDLLAAQRELEELGAPVAANGQLHHAAGSPAHAGDRASEVRTDVGTVDAHDLVTGAQSRPLRGRAIDRSQDLHHPPARHHLDADAGIGAHGREADLVEFLAVEVGRVRIERRDHAADRFLHQGVVIDLIDVIALDAFVDLGEETRLLPRQPRAAGGRLAVRRQRVRPVGEHAAAESPAEAEERPRCECDERAFRLRHGVESSPRKFGV